MKKTRVTSARITMYWFALLIALFCLSACSSPNEANTPPPDTQEFDASNTDDTTPNTQDDTTENDTTQNTQDDTTENDTTPDNRCDTDCGHGTCIKVDGIDTCECNPGYHAEDLYCRINADACQGEDCPMLVQEWQARFDDYYQNPHRLPEDCVFRSKTGGEDQEHYYLAYCIDGLTSIWRATGDDAYLDEVLKLIENTMATTLVDPNGRRYWKGPNGDIGRGYALWDSYYLRNVTTLLRVMHTHDELLQRDGFGERYEEALTFVREVWDFWMNVGKNQLYRGRTHMASHWARMGMDLFLITGEEHYKEVFDNISHGTMYRMPSNLRAQFKPNPTHPEAYTWSQVFGEEPSESVQDTSHAGAVVSFVFEAALAGQYWTQADIDALIATLLQVIWDPTLDGAFYYFIDATEGVVADTPRLYGLRGRLHEWLHLGRYRPDIQARIETEYMDPKLRNATYFGYQIYGIAALNARVLADGKPYY